jgi:hypothetical protein
MTDIRHDMLARGVRLTRSLRLNKAELIANLGLTAGMLRPGLVSTANVYGWDENILSLYERLVFETKETAWMLELLPHPYPHLIAAQGSLDSSLSLVDAIPMCQDQPGSLKAVLRRVGIIADEALSAAMAAATPGLASHAMTVIARGLACGHGLQFTTSLRATERTVYYAVEAIGAFVWLALIPRCLMTDEDYVTAFNAAARSVMNRPKRVVEAHGNLIEENVQALRPDARSILRALHDQTRFAPFFLEIGADGRNLPTKELAAKHFYVPYKLPDSIETFSHLYSMRGTIAPAEILSGSIPFRSDLLTTFLGAIRGTVFTLIPNVYDTIIMMAATIGFYVERAVFSPAAKPMNPNCVIASDDLLISVDMYGVFSGLFYPPHNPWNAYKDSLPHFSISHYSHDHHALELCMLIVWHVIRVAGSLVTFEHKLVHWVNVINHTLHKVFACPDYTAHDIQMIAQTVYAVSSGVANRSPLWPVFTTLAGYQGEDFGNVFPLVTRGKLAIPNQITRNTPIALGRAGPEETPLGGLVVWNVSQVPTQFAVLDAQDLFEKCRALALPDSFTFSQLHLLNQTNDVNGIIQVDEGKGICIETILIFNPVLVPVGMNIIVEAPMVRVKMSSERHRLAWRAVGVQVPYAPLGNRSPLDADVIGRVVSEGWTTPTPPLIRGFTVGGVLTPYCNLGSRLLEGSKITSLLLGDVEATRRTITLANEKIVKLTDGAIFGE